MQDLINRDKSIQRSGQASEVGKGAYNLRRRSSPVGPKLRTSRPARAQHIQPGLVRACFLSVLVDLLLRSLPDAQVPVCPVVK